jgi:peptidoglycan lytic transglycosylase D
MTRISSMSIGLLLAAACVRPETRPLSPRTAESPPSTAAPTSRPASAPYDSTAGAGGTHADSVFAGRQADGRLAVAPESIRVSDRDITRRLSEIFGDSAAAIAAAPESPPEAPSWDIEVRSYESTSRVEHYVQLFSGPSKERIAARLGHGTRYEPMIREKMREGGIPEDMYYLALIESGFDPNAYSRAAAVGMWQFMTSTAHDMGLRVDWWIDERRDPVRSTTAAVRFLRDLQDQFGSLYLAAAAYNGGPGRIARGLTRYADDLEGTAGDDLFFALAEKNYLRNETREYVPQLIAAALIAKEPERYGMQFATEAPFAYDSVRVGPSTPLPAVADAAKATLSAVQSLNPHILRGMTPPRDSFTVRIPVGAADSFALVLAELPRASRVATRGVESKKGETFESIARKNGISARHLALFNPKAKRLKSGRLVIGQSLLVPTPAVAAAMASVPDPAIERYPSAPKGGRSTLHVVKSGETLSGIAVRYHTTTAAIMRANGLRRTKIVPGQSLVVTGASTAKHRKATTPAAKPQRPVSKKRASASAAKKAGATKGGAR